MKNKLSTLFVCLVISFCSIAQIKEQYLVSSKILNVRSGPGKEFQILKTLKLNDTLNIINKKENEWWKVEHHGTMGFVNSAFLVLDSNSLWERKIYQTGVTPDCENIIPKYDYEIENYLRIIVGSHTDVIVKLMKKDETRDECIRIVYVRSGDTFDMKNIPEGKYYVKIAYGKDYRKRIIENKCYVKFMKFSLYEKGNEIFDFNLIKKPDQIIKNVKYENWDIPSYVLSLDIIQTYDSGQTFKTGNISEIEFNK